MSTQSRLSYLRWAVVLLSSSPAMAQQTQGIVAKNPADVRLAAIPDAPACFVAAVEEGNPAKEASVMMMRGTAGCSVPRHWHPSAERIMLIEGSARAEVADTGVTLMPGGYLSVPPRHPMRFACMTSCELFVYTDGPFEIHYVDATGREIPAAEALKPTKRGARP